MATRVPDALYSIYGLIAPYLSSDRKGGIANPNSPGYHTSREDLIRQGRSDNYSIQAPADRRGNPANAAGIDITLSDAEMKTVSTRLRKACTPVDGKYDDRIECVREFIGTVDGRNVSGYNRYATGSGSRSTVGWKSSGFSDSSHLWHVHISVFRDRVENVNEMRGLAEVIAGLPAGALGWVGAGVDPKPAEPVPPVVVPPVVVPPKLPTYTVRAGDTLSRIADRLGVTWQSLAALNPGVKPDRIQVGQVLTVPKTVPPVVKPTTPKPEPKPEPTVTHTVTIAGFNILRETDTMKGRERWPERRPDVIKHLKAAKASVALLCEVDKSTCGDVADGLGWSYYPSGFNTGKEFSPLGILWDPDVWRREKDAFVEEYSDNENRFLMRLPLIHKASGKEVWFYSSHLENDGDTATDGHKARKIETTEWAKWTLDGPGVFYADLNSTTRSGSNDTTREREKPRPILKGAGWKFLTDQSGVANRELETHHGGLSRPSDRGPWIDDMGFKGVTYVDGALIRTDGTDASDHNLLSITIKF